MPDVTVVIPTRNRRALLAEAIESVRGQAGVEFEVIVVNDASEDDTQSFLANQQGIRSLHQSVRGERSRARNIGLENAIGRYVMFLDDDDLLRPGALAVLAGSLDRNHDAVASVGARWDWFVHKNRGRRDTHPRFARKQMTFDEFLFGWSAVSGQCLYRTEVVRAVGGYDNSLDRCEDRDLWLKVSRRGPVVLRPEVVMTYRIPEVQNRPANTREYREIVANRALAGIKGKEKEKGLAIRRCSTLVQAGEDQMKLGNPLRAIGHVARALTASPRVFLNPLTGAWIGMRIARAAAHAMNIRRV